MNKAAFLFPGQGSQFIRMGRDLCDKSTAARQIFEEANDALGFDLLKLCVEGNLEELTRTENAQPAILTTSVAAFRVYMQEIYVEPLYCAGHSLGEFSALVCSGAIRFSDAVKIVRQRGKIMQEAVPVGLGAMSAIVGISKDIVEDECKKNSTMENMVMVSNYNSPEQTVISGHSDAVGKVCKRLGELGARVIPLKVSAPFHSPLMQPAADRLRDELKKYTYHELKYPVISNVTALPYESKASIIDNLVMQIVWPVRWVDSMKYLSEQGIDFAVELGPQTVLKNLMKKNVPGIVTYSFDKEEDIISLKKKILNDEDDNLTYSKENGLKLITKCITIAVCTKNHNWDNDEYQKGVIEPYRRIQQMLGELEVKGEAPSIEQMKNALEMLMSVFITKKTPVGEQEVRFSQIFDETGLKGFFSGFKPSSE